MRKLRLREIVRKAREEADYTVAAARKEATDMIAAAGASAKESMKTLRETAGQRRKKLTVKAMDVATAEIGHLRDRATSMESEVTSMIISELVG